MTMELSPSYANEYLLAAEETQREAEVLANSGLLKGALNRAYYAMFYAASAALVAQHVKLPKSHRALITLFFRHLVEPKKMQRDFHRNLVRAFQLRQQGDYEVHVQVGEDEVRETLDKAVAFIAEVKKMVAAG